jgi:hypothetical protein
VLVIDKGALVPGVLPGKSITSTQGDGGAG